MITVTSRSWSTLGVALVLLAAALSVSSGAWSVAADEAIGVSSGVFSEEQAERGGVAFAQHCAGCHGAELEGAFGPALMPLDPGHFRDAPLAKLFDLMRTEMPFSAPGSLGDETYLDILTYVLQANGYPSGVDELELDEGELARLIVDQPPAE